MATPLRQHSERPDSDLAPALAGSGTPGPRGRPSWSGLLRLSLVTVPVQAHPVCSSTAPVHFHQLHANCGQRIRHQKRCPIHGAVEASDIERGYLYASDQYVVIEPEELNKLRPAKDRALVLEHFVPSHQVDPVLFAGRSLYLVPDGLAARHPYGVVAEALQQGGQWALGRVVLSTQRQLVLVRPRGPLLVMDVLHYPAEIRAPTTWEAGLSASAATAEEIRLTRTLMDASSGPVDWARYRDVTAEELTALVEAKIAGRPLSAPAENSVSVPQLLAALQQSVAAAKATPKSSQGRSPKPRFRRRATG
jgi:DNA end-binding protein Ku